MDVLVKLENLQCEFEGLQRQLTDRTNEIKALIAIVNEKNQTQPNNITLTSKVTCRGSFQLNSACGHCKRCVNELLLLLKECTFTPDGEHIFPIDKEVVTKRVAEKLFKHYRS